MEVFADLIRAFFWFGGIVFWMGALIFMRSKYVDHSNLFNFLRSYAFMCKHAKDLVFAYYLTPAQVRMLYGQIKKAFPYIQYDEFSEIVNSRNEQL